MRGTTTFSPSERAAKVRQMVGVAVFLAAARIENDIWGEKVDCD